MNRLQFLVEIRNRLIKPIARYAVSLEDFRVCERIGAYRIQRFHARDQSHHIASGISRNIRGGYPCCYQEKR